MTRGGRPGTPPGGRAPLRKVLRLAICTGLGFSGSRAQRRRCAARWAPFRGWRIVGRRFDAHAPLWPAPVSGSWTKPQVSGLKALRVGPVKPLRGILANASWSARGTGGAMAGQVLAYTPPSCHRTRPGRAVTLAR